jgi:hypothetical protein
MGCANYTITFNCVEAETINVVYIVLNAPEYGGGSAKTATIRQNWSDGTTDSPSFQRTILMEEDGISAFETVNGQESSGAIPVEASTVTLDLLEDDSFEFNTGKHSFKYLVSNTEYTEANINTLIPLLNTTATITNPSDGTYRSTFTYNNLSDEDYLYIVWDLRYSNQRTLYFGAASDSTACCSGISGTYYLNGTTFGSATMIYTDADLLIEAADGYYANSQSGGSYREIETVGSEKQLNGNTVCASCASNSYEFEIDPTQIDNLDSEDCSTVTFTSSLYKSDSYPLLQRNDVMYTDAALTTAYNGNNKWIAIRKPGFTQIYFAQIDGSGNVLYLYICF